MEILICDSDPNSVEHCKKQIAFFAKKNDIIANIQTTHSGSSVLLFQDTKYAKLDLIYLDQYLPGMSGIETAFQLRKNGLMADIVFYTENDLHAVDGYDVEALHYLVKDQATSDKFEEVFLKAARRADARSTDVLALSCAGEHRNILLKNIYYFDVDKRILTVHYKKESQMETFSFYSSLSKIEEALFGKGFLRIHSSFLVSEQYIFKCMAHDVELFSGERLPIGKSYRTNIKDFLSRSFAAYQTQLNS